MIRLFGFYILLPSLSDYRCGGSWWRPACTAGRCRIRNPV